jgi:hypothetical protein
LKPRTRLAIREEDCSGVNWQASRGTKCPITIELHVSFGKTGMRMLRAMVAVTKPINPVNGSNTSHIQTYTPRGPRFAIFEAARHLQSKFQFESQHDLGVPPSLVLTSYQGICPSDALVADFGSTDTACGGLSMSMEDSTKAQLHPLRSSYSSNITTPLISILLYRSSLSYYQASHTKKAL